MRKCATLVIIGFAAACATIAPRTVPYPNAQFGRFAFIEPVAGSSRALVIEGEFVVTPDTVTVTEKHAACDPIQPPDLRLFSYRCGDVTFSFDRRDPARRAQYTVRGQRLAMRTRWDGGFVFAGGTATRRLTNEEYEVEATFTGRLHSTPVGSR